MLARLALLKKTVGPGMQADVLALFHRQLAQDTQKTINNFLKIQAIGSPHLRQDIKLIRDLVMQYTMPSKATLSSSLLLLEQEDQRAALSKITMPFLRIYGKLDGLVPKKVINKVTELSAASDVLVFEHSSHAPFISELSLFISALSAWLNQCD